MTVNLNYLSFLPIPFFFLLYSSKCSFASHLGRFLAHYCQKWKQRPAVNLAALRPSSPPLLLADTVSFFSRAGLNASMETAWYSFARWQTWRFSHPENAAAAPNARLTFNTSGDGCRVEHQLKMESRNTEKKCSDCKWHRTSALPCPRRTRQPSQDTSYVLPTW